STIEDPLDRMGPISVLLVPMFFRFAYLLHTMVGKSLCVNIWCVQRRVSLESERQVSCLARVVEPGNSASRFKSRKAPEPWHCGHQCQPNGPPEPVAANHHVIVVVENSAALFQESHYGTFRCGRTCTVPQ